MKPKKKKTDPQPKLFDEGGLKDWQGGEPAEDPQPDGATYEPEHDRVRLTGLLDAVFQFMFDGEWRTLAEIRAAINRGTETSISARLRDLRKKKFGAWTVDRKRIGNPKDGLHAYRLVGAHQPQETT